MKNKYKNQSYSNVTNVPSKYNEKIYCSHNYHNIHLQKFFKIESFNTYTMKITSGC